MMILPASCQNLRWQEVQALQLLPRLMFRVLLLQVLTWVRLYTVQRRLYLRLQR